MASRTVLDNVAGTLVSKGVSVDLGDGVVGVPSATSGEHPEYVPECRYTADLGRAAADRGLVWAKLKAEVEAAKFNPLVTSVFGTMATTCGHVGQSRLIQLTNQVLGAVAGHVSRGEPVFAYTNPQGIAMVRNNKIFSQAAGPGCGAGGQFYEPPVWSRDGRHVATVSWNCEDDGLGPPNQADNRLLILNTLTPTVRRVTCGCSKVAAIDGSRMAFVNHQGKAFILDLAADAGVKAWNVHLPAGLYARETLAGVTGSVLLYATRAKPGTDQYADPYDSDSGALLTVGTDGRSTLLRDLEEVYSVNVVAASADHAPGGPRFVYTTIESFGDCAHPGKIWVADLTGSKQVATNTDALTANGGEAFMTDAWWGANGNLFATLSTTLCDPLGGKPIVKPSLWRLDDERWVSIDKGPLTYVRQLNAATKVVVIDNGDLYVERNGGPGTKLASEVNGIEAPPHQGRITGSG
nr:hypothetical protein [uncultured bacterium]